MRHPRQVLTRSTIFENVWGYDFGPTSNALGVYMGYLRRKTEAATSRGSCTPSEASATCCGTEGPRVPLRRRVAIACASPSRWRSCSRRSSCYVVVREQLLGQVDSELRAQAGGVQRAAARCSNSSRRPPPSAGGGAPIWQVSTSRGSVVCSDGNVALPIDRRRAAIAGGNGGDYLEDVKVNGTVLRELTVPVHDRRPVRGAEPAAFQLARPLAPVRNVLSDLRLVLFLLCAGGIALAACLGRLAARRVLAPLAEVAADRSAHHRHRGPDQPHPVPRRRRGRPARDPLQRDDRAARRLPRGALDESVRAQRQLVADASHELRTPITSLRTNIEVLMAGGELERRGPPPAAGRRARAERGAERADRGRDRTCPRRPADHRQPTTSGSTASSPSAYSRPARLPRASGSRAR